LRYLEYEKVVSAIEKLCVSACYELPTDVLDALKKAKAEESNPVAADILGKLLENASIAKDEMIPLCQDTGIAVVFVKQGEDVAVQTGRDDGMSAVVSAINAGVASGYEKGYLRKSVVAEPLHLRANTKTNTPAIIHHEIVAGDKLEISVMTKGGGCENKSQFKMFRPTDDKQVVIDWVVDVVGKAGADACPPFIIGVGIGGNFELSCLLSKKALLRKLTDKNPDVFYAELESDILKAVNKLGVGPQGLGGDTTALGCMIETAGCHIASLPVAVNIECHSHRHRTIIL